MPVSNTFAFLMYGLQGATLDAILLDLGKPDTMSRDELWMSLFVLLSRVRSLEDLIIYRLPSKHHFEGGPPQFLQNEMRRLESLQLTTITRLDRDLQKFECQELRTLVTEPLLQSLQEQAAAAKKRRQEASPAYTPARRGAKTTRMASSPKSPALLSRTPDRATNALTQVSSPSVRRPGARTPELASPKTPVGASPPVFRPLARTPPQVPNDDPVAAPPPAFRPLPRTATREQQTVHANTMDYINEMSSGTAPAASSSAPSRSPVASPKPKSKCSPVSPSAPSTSSPAATTKASPAQKTKRAKPTTFMRKQLLTPQQCHNTSTQYHHRQ